MSQTAIAVVRSDPTGEPIPLVCDSPHSGTTYPADFDHVVPLALLRQGEDTHVDALWAAAPQFGATLVAATFPRTYIDPNRSLSDLDPDALDGRWPEVLSPGEKTRLGKGLVWTRMDARNPIYGRRLSVAEVRHRIDSYYAPYHAVLAQAIQERYDQFGALWHMNLHSMPNDAYERLGLLSDRPLADFVLGDRDGTTCEPAFVQLIEDVLRGKGYTVARNNPYKGVQLIAQIGQPAQHRHSLQIEIRRPVYMDEASRERNEGFLRLESDLGELLREVRAYVKGRI
ncbi:N-formylglutamate amidohydrolase [Pollutimonas nitritireducens]|uniref:N-formylglutamate amidohydrolase n=1 Tax=Pollutimonas nitritireducens TaxID=2045209 RepID=A0A2N4UEA9_9BURK|nr:N-formylglutamate amidohydrolase [Pollutimonas nitritireducens]PLC53346.1 N-formylglutamate amidohydrolase [Pollutimonas nitritireducens]